LDVCLCHSVRRAARALSRLYDAALAPFGLKSGQFSLLTAIAAQGPVSVSRLGDIMRMDASTLSRNLKPLRAAGYLESDGASGRRAGQIALTSAGGKLLADALPAWQAVQSEVTRKVGSGTAGSLLQGLEATAKALK
jgi:DNA-binding MarR family transcriptional regulator